jgi:two-component system sensor kinase FixL
MLVAEVEDTGPGIAPEHLGRLFDSFFTTRPGGMGIGLAICRSIIVAHSGSIEAANLPGGGARFRISLPVATLDDDLDHARPGTPEPGRDG